MSSSERKHHASCRLAWREEVAKICTCGTGSSPLPPEGAQEPTIAIENRILRRNAAARLEMLAECHRICIETETYDPEGDGKPVCSVCLHTVDQHSGSCPIGKLNEVLADVAPAEPKRAEGETRWQPMASAPKDGTWILVSTGRRFVVAVRSVERFTGERQWVDHHNYDHEAIVWMPLPAPPAAGPKEAK